MINFLTTPVLYGLAAVAITAGVTAGVQTVRVAGLKAEVQTEKRKAETVRADQAEAVRDAVEDALDRQAAQVDADKKVLSDGILQAKALAADAFVAAGAADRLRIAAEAASRRCSSRPAVTATGVSPPASAPGDLLSYVLRRLDEAAGGIGDFAESAHAAGTQCQRIHDNAVKASQ